MTTQTSLSAEPYTAHEEPQSALFRSVEAFLFREARLLDEHRYEEWLELWYTEGDICYWVPCNADDIDPKTHVSLVYDNRARLAERITRLRSPAAHSQDPPSRTARIISNIEVSETDKEEVSVRCVQALGEFRKGEQTSYFGRVSHRLIRGEKSLSIKEKKILLINNDGYIHNLTFLL